MALSLGVNGRIMRYEAYKTSTSRAGPTDAGAGRVPAPLPRPLRPLRGHPRPGRAGRLLVGEAVADPAEVTHGKPSPRAGRPGRPRPAPGPRPPPRRTSRAACTPPAAREPSAAAGGGRGRRSPPAGAAGR